MTDSATQRLNMVESQVRPSDVTDRRIIRAMLELPREKFMPPSLRPMAYMDEELRLGDENNEARAMLRPMVLAKIVQLARIEPGDLVLEIGATTGYCAALLSRLAGSVVSLESSETLAAKASENLSSIAADSVAVVTGPLAEGYPDEGPYDVILFNGSVPAVPDNFAMQLKPGGRLVAIVGEGAAARAMVFERVADHLSGAPAFSCSASRLPGFDAAPAFVF